MHDRRYTGKETDNGGGPQLWLDPKQDAGAPGYEHRTADLHGDVGLGNFLRSGLLGHRLGLFEMIDAAENEEATEEQAS
jgi:hypothetical protein